MLQSLAISNRDGQELTKDITTRHMELQHVNVKLPIQGALPVAPGRFIEVFHKWIQEESLGELLIDVADYAHVPDGPGIVLVGHESDYSMDHTGGRWGLRYNRKAPFDGTNADRFRQALTAAARAASMLESILAAEGPLSFSRSEFELFINDRAIAPNTPATWDACRPELEVYLRSAFGVEFTLKHDARPRCRFGINVAFKQPIVWPS